MTKQSANPRRYSRGSAALDPMQNLSVYFAVHLPVEDLKSTLGRIEYLSEQHPDAVVDLAGYRWENGEVVLTLEVSMGPARDALRGSSARLHSGYDLLWDAVKTLYYAHPVLCGPPHPEERERANKINEYRTDADPATETASL